MNPQPKAVATGQTDSGENEEPSFPYSAELIATIAAHFLDGNSNESAACERAIKLLEAASNAVRVKTIMLQGRKKAERSAEETPQSLPFAKGVRWITGRSTETEATKEFRNYLRLNIRQGEIHHPRSFTTEQIAALFRELPEGPAKDTEDAEIQKIEAKFRSKGFDQIELAKGKETFDRMQNRIVRPFRNSENGKKGGRRPGSKKSPK